uniref:RxLR effector protein n=1 Tax=Phytophthora sojae TaxID=67593 RepID=G1FSJ4_PHYSO|nr:Avh270 [Phytophthora sojae]AEK81083.1 Avh270 [Phytophthora sojae]
MRSIFVVLLALAASVGASSVVTESNVATDHAIMNGPNHMVTKRLLRTETLPEEEEERANFEFVKKLKNLLKPKSVAQGVPAVIAKESQQLQAVAKESQQFRTVAQTLAMDKVKLPKGIKKMLDAQASTDDVAKALNIKHGEPIENLFRKEVLPTYVRYSELASKKTITPDIYGIGSLRKEFTDIELSAIINAGMKSSDELTFAAADRLRAGQFDDWLRQGTTPHDVYQLLRAGGKTISDADRVNWRKYLNKFNALHKG